MAFWSRVTAFITGGAVTRAASEAVSPVLEPVRQHAWEQNQVRVIPAGEAAELRAQGLITDSAAHAEASRQGVNANRVDALVQMLQAAPSFGELEQMLNRGTAGLDDVRAALAKHKIPPKWWPWLIDLYNHKLDPVQLANAIHRGLIPDPGLLAVGPPTGEGNVKAYPVYPIDALAEAKADGFDKDRLGVLVGLQGLPMGPHEAAQAEFRGILTMDDFQRAIAEGNTRNEWGQAIYEQSRQIPTARDFFENALRGYHDLTWAQEQAKRHGMSEADSLVIYQNQGRPMALTSITKALARGGQFNPEPGEITEPYTASIVEGNLKPGYYDLAHHLIYTYPSAFVFRQLAEAGTLGGQAEVKQWLLEIGWPPKLADLAATAWTTAKAKADPYISKADTQLWTALHKAYTAGPVDPAVVAADFDLIGVAPDARAAVLARWDAEKAL